MKKKRKKKRYGVLAFFFVLFFGGGIAFYVYAQNDTTTKATNTVEVGNVDVELDMKNHNAGVISPGAVNVGVVTQGAVTPGAISNAVRVSNVGDYSAYIRMYVKKYWKITQGGTELTPEQIAANYPKLSVNAIDIYLKDGWTKGSDNPKYPGYECYYYEDAVPGINSRGVNVVPFSDYYQLKTEQTPGDGGVTNELLLKFTENGAKVDGFYEVFVEAIQADTCIPVTNGENKIVNWNDTPDDSAHMPHVSIDPAATPVGVVNFKSENTDITNADSFITMNNLVPGTTKERVVEIKNTSDKKLPVYVYAETAEPFDQLNEDQQKWLEQLQLIVGKKDGTILYQDSFYKPNSDIPMLSKDKPILIGEFPSNTSENLYVAIHCPASWEKGNVQVKVNWIFASKKAVPDPTKRPSGGGGGYPVIPVTKTPEITQGPVSETEAPQKTEDVEVTPFVTDAPTISAEPSEEPKEEETIPPGIVDPKPESTDKVTEEPLPTPAPSNGIKPLESENPDSVTATPEELRADSTPENVPKRTSTPKKSTKVKEVYPTKTGDATPIFVWLVLFVVSGMGMVVTFFAWRKRE